jgi:ribose transport system ATP-binding protein
VTAGLQAEMNVPQVAARNISKRFGGVQALTDVSLVIQRGTIHALLGENGAGKSTLVKILAGVEPADTGQILIRGQWAEIHSPQDARRLGISVVHQELSLFPDLTVLSNVFAGRELYNRLGWLDSRQMKAELQQVMDAVGWWIDPDALVNSLSLGERQMVEILRAFRERADLIILDEPNSALTDRETQALFSIVRQLRSKGCAFLLVSHRLDEVFSIADYITVLRDGKHVATMQAGEVSLREAVVMMVGDNQVSQGEARAPAKLNDKTLLLRVSNLQGAIFEKVSFDAARGEILGFAGLEGSGIQELFSVLFGLEQAVDGEMFLRGTAYKPRHPKDAITQGLGFIPADRKEEGLLMDRSVGENTVLVILDKVMSRLGFITDQQIALKAKPHLMAFRVRTPSLETPVVQLSGGNQQKVVLAKWLANAPSLLILNDPTRGVDVGAKREVHTTIKELTLAGITVLLWSSDAAETLEVTDRILVMSKGRLTREFNPRTTSLNQLLLAVFGESDDAVRAD